MFCFLVAESQSSDIPTARIERAQKFLMMIAPRLARSQSENVDVGRSDGMVWEFPIASQRRCNVALSSQLLTPLRRRWRSTSRRDKGQTKCCDGRIVVELCGIVIDASRIGGILWAGKVRAGAPVERYVLASCPPYRDSIIGLLARSSNVVYAFSFTNRATCLPW